MKKITIIAFIMLMLPISTFCQKKKDDVTVIVVTDEITLDHGQTLKKGEYAQLVANKSTSEGMFVRTKKDSSLVYESDVAFVAFSIKDMDFVDLNTNKTIKISKSFPMILEHLKNGLCFLKYNDFNFKVKESLITLHNKTFYKSIVLQK